jgi:hypothetical protein
MRVWHYLYFPTEGVASGVAAHLTAAGYGAEVRGSGPQ